jgi:thioester reductase-like protein
MEYTPDALHAEINLDADITPDGPFRPVSTPSVVLLTGGTGFLGAFVIADLLRFTQADIYCLVRADDAAAAKARLVDNLVRYGRLRPDAESRVFALAGDLEHPTFNLDAQTYDWLAENTDTIYHLAASVSFMPGYQQMKATNVTGLKHVLRMACQRRTKAVHYTSTYAVFNSEAYTLARTVYETELTGSSAGFIRGYDRSKWVAERIVRIAQDRGIPVNIYRAGFISGDSDSGVANKMDPIAQMFAVGLCTGYAFHIEALLHLTPVDFCSTALVKLSLHPQTTNRIFHLVQEQPLSCFEILSWLADEGYPLAYVTFAEWYEALKGLCRRYTAFTPVLYLFSLKDNKPFGEEENISSLYFDASNVHRYLEPVYHCPKLQSTVLRRYFDYITSPERGYQVMSKKRKG